MMILTQARKWSEVAMVKTLDISMELRTYAGWCTEKMLTTD